MIYNDPHHNTFYSYINNLAVADFYLASLARVKEDD